MAEIDSGMLGVIAEAVKNHQCILFMGAAVHSPPPDGDPYGYPDGERPPLGSALSRRLAVECDFAKQYPGENTENLQRVSLAYEIKFKRPRLVSVIKSMVDDGKIASPAVRGLAELGFPLVITTNYDKLYERALSDLGKRPEICVYNPSDDAITDEFPGRDDPSPQKPFIIKIHGDIEKPESLVVTGEDYIQFVLRIGDKEGAHPVPTSVRARLKQWPVLFIGYSLVDYNLRILLKALRWKTDIAKLAESYAVDRSPDPLVRTVLENSQNFTYIVEDIWAFVPQLYEAVMGVKMPNER